VLSEQGAKLKSLLIGVALVGAIVPLTAAVWVALAILGY
jgi:hypothetical protein